MALNPHQLILHCEQDLRDAWAVIDERCHSNTQRVMSGFIEAQVDESHFTSVTGYGHNDTGRSVADALFANAFNAEAAIVRLQFVSGTHAISCALRAALKPGSRLLSVTGAPYDTLEEMIGKRGESPLSLIQQGVQYQEINLFKDKSLPTRLEPLNIQAIADSQVIFIQRSRGYSADRPSLTLDTLEQWIRCIKQANPDCVVVVDNCYGEFVYTQEPCAVGADLVAGSLIKNPGAGIVPTGGYVAGKAYWVEAAAEALTCPGIGADGGYTFNATRLILQGLFLAPSIVKEALKSMSLFASVFEALGYTVSPAPDSFPQADIIQVIQLQNADNVLAFTKTLQSCSPVGSRLTPIPAVTPGYQDPVVMAGGTFIFGSTIELSADAPMREPYALFLQGGLSYSHSRFVLERMLNHWPSTHPNEKVLSLA